MRQYSLMIVDDEELARRHILHDISWETLGVGPLYEAADGEAALEKIPKLRPDIMILDIRMPKLDGIGVLERLPEYGCRPQVIALSSYSDFEAARKMLSSGIVVEYLLKPASEDQLFEAVYKCIEKIEEKNAYAKVQTQPEPEAEEELPESASAEGGRESTGAARTAMIRTVKQYMEEHYVEKLTLAAVAETIPVNASYLSKIFSEVEHMGFADYLCQIRMRHAKELLMNYTLRIYEIAGMVGYQDVKHFMKTFKKHEGVTPSEYREAHLLDF